MQRSIPTNRFVAKGVLKLAMKKIIAVLFYILLFLVPLIFLPFTSEVFEFNKIILVYILTTLIMSTWIVRMVIEKKIIFSRTILDIPLLAFIGSQLISTIISIDPRTSFLGYYSRFNGGLLSTVCYSLLYWAFVSNMDAKSTLYAIRYTLISAALISVYGVLEHFGIDKNLWVQAVQDRVFSTLGQPNWLAAWLTALMPITWALILNINFKTKGLKAYLQSKTFWIYFSLSALFFLTLLFTKSRSGFLGFVVADVAFWSLVFWKSKKETVKSLLIINSSFLILAILIGTQFTPNIFSLINKSINQPVSKPQGPALEIGGTESGTIRKIVWKGALQVWLHYPIFGSGVETFAYAYYKYRPVEHNLVSEWDFIYNKAHNEYLNFMANSGTASILAYLTFIGFSIYQILKTQDKLAFAFFAGYVSLLVTNFFGFSVVPTQLQLFLFPAIAVILANSDKQIAIRKQKISKSQKILILVTLIATSYLLITISKYWYSDYLYNMGRSYNTQGNPDVATKYLTKVVEITANTAIYHNELASSYADIAVALNQQKNPEKAKEFADLAISESDKAISLSPANINLKRSRFGFFIKLSIINQNYLLSARDTLIDAINMAPTDAKIYYNLGLTYARIDELDKAIEVLAKTIELKSNYKEARLAYAILLVNKGQNAEAKSQLEYILTNIDPNDSLTKQTLESIK